MYKRSAIIKLDRIIENLFKLTRGLFQGSLVSLGLFMLYIQLIFYCLFPLLLKSRFSYIDNICLLALSYSLTTNCKILKQEFADLSSWAYTEGLSFNTDKTDLLYLSRHYSKENPSIIVNLENKIHMFSLVNLKELLKWLGVYLDRKLFFLIHAKSIAAKAYSTATHIKSLSNTVYRA